MAQMRFERRKKLVAFAVLLVIAMVTGTVATSEAQQAPSNGQDFVHFSRDELVFRKTTVLSQHDGFQVRFVEETVYSKAGKPVRVYWATCTVFDDGSIVYIPKPCPKEPKKPKVLVVTAIIRLLEESGFYERSPLPLSIKE